MSGDDGLRQTLVNVLHNLTECDDAPWGGDPACEVGADALLPVVRAFAAQELRAAAREVRDNHGTASLSAKRIDARADALTAVEARP